MTFISYVQCIIDCIHFLYYIYRTLGLEDLFIDWILLLGNQFIVCIFSSPIGNGSLTKFILHYQALFPYYYGCVHEAFSLYFNEMIIYKY